MGVMLHDIGKRWKIKELWKIEGSKIMFSCPICSGGLMEMEMI